VKEELRAEIAKAVTSLVQAGKLPEVPITEIRIERPRDPAHGDFSSNFALIIAAAAKRKPREVAEMMKEELSSSPLSEKVEVAGPGFINFFLKRATLQGVVTDILQAGADYGCDRSGRHGKILVEFVSANPTGPMHVGHGRGAAYGDSLCNILAATGWEVRREYYINDAGRQADILALSVWLRYLECCGEAVALPRRAYAGDYVRASAEKLHALHGDAFLHPAATVLAGMGSEPCTADDAGDEEKAKVKAQQEAHVDALLQRARALLGEGFDNIQREALADQLDEIKATLDSFGVRFDEWCSERELVAQGYLQRAIAQLRDTGQVYEKDGAQWLRTSVFGDEKDRVLFKADGTATYFANDVAYHIHKLQRGYPLLLDVLGADHHGYVPRVRAAIEALTGRKDVLQVQLMQFVTLSSGRMGKRSGYFVTLKELIAEAGRDAARYFYLQRSHDQHLEFDIDLARSQSTDNPVFYVQYAHARICSVFRQLQEKGLRWNNADGQAHLHLLSEPQEQALLTTLSRFPEVLDAAGKLREPHQLAHYLLQLANDYHVYYNAHRFITAPEHVRNARLNLCAASREVLHKGMTMLGVTAPETM
jgi:arginyl-tRNA synthetase